MNAGLNITTEEIDRCIVLRLEGRLDASTTPVLERKMLKLLDEHRTILLLDFNGVDYLSSAGMRLLLSVTKKTKAQKGTLVLFALSEDVHEIIKMAGFDRILHICSNEQEALQQS